MTSPDELGPNPLLLLARRARATARRRLSPGRRVSLMVLLLIALHMAFRVWSTSRSWFMWDDYIFLADVSLGADDMAWLFHSHFSLFMPFSFLLVKMVGSAGLDWSVIATQILAMQLIAAVSCWWMLRTLFGNRMRILIPMAFYLASPLTMPSAVWWSVSINQIPHHIAIFGAVAAHVRYVRSGRIGWAVAAAGFLLLGLASYAKAPLIVVLLVAMTFCWFTTGTWRHRARTMLASWPAWTMYGLMTIAYVWIWRQQKAPPAPALACDLPGVINNSWVETLGTSLVGGPWGWKLWGGGVDPFVASSGCVPQAFRGDPALIVGGAPQSLLAPSLAGLIFAWVLLSALVFYRWSRYRNALLSLWFVVPYVVLSTALVYLGRAGTFGSQVSAREVRYFSDIAVIGAIAVGAALMPVIGASQSVERRSRPYLLMELRRPLLGAVALIYLIGSLYSSVTYVRPWHETFQATQFPERVFVNTVKAELASIDRSDLPVRIADVPLPIVVANPVIYPYNLPSRKLAPLRPSLQAVSAGTDLSILDAQGHIREATVPDSPRAAPGPVENCGYLVQSSGTAIPVVPVVNLPWWIRMDYLAGADGTVTVSAGESTRTVEIERGLHTMFVSTVGGFDDVRLTAAGDLSLCIDTVHVGQLQPKDGGSTP